MLQNRNYLSNPSQKFLSNWLELASCVSTNRVAAELDEPPEGQVVWALEQTGGRGQRGSTWESLPGQNLTFSLVLRPGFLEPRRQFRLSQVVCLGAAEALSQLAGQTVWLKWPNDLFAEERKIGGLLLESQIGKGRVAKAIAGLGLNTNQVRFAHAGATSLRLLSGQVFPLREVLIPVLGAIGYWYAALGGGKQEALHQAYLQRLLGRHRWRYYREAATAEVFEAQILDVGPEGTLVLADRQGRKRRYWFKEVELLRAEDG